MNSPLKNSSKEIALLLGRFIIQEGATWMWVLIHPDYIKKKRKHAIQNVLGGSCIFISKTQ